MRIVATFLIPVAVLATPAAPGEDPPMATKRATIRFGKIPRVVAFGARGMAFSPDSRLLAAGNTQEGTAVWEVATGKQVRTPQPEAKNEDNGGLADLSQLHGMMPGGGSVFLPDNKTLVVAGAMFGLQLLDIETGKWRVLGPPVEQKPGKGKAAMGKGMTRPLRYLAFHRSCRE